MGCEVTPGYVMSRNVSTTRGKMGEDEMPPLWRKSSFSQSGDCVEWIYSEALVHVRNSKDPSGHALEFTHSEWQAFISGVKSGEADLNVEDI